MESLSGCETSLRPISTKFSMKEIWQLSEEGSFALKVSLGAFGKSWEEEVEFWRDIWLSRSIIAPRSLAARWRRCVEIVSSTEPSSSAQFRAKSVFSLHLNLCKLSSRRASKRETKWETRRLRNQKCWSIFSPNFASAIVTETL